MRELRSIKERRLEKRRAWLRRLFLVLAIAVVAGAGIFFAATREKARSSSADLAPGKIYTKEARPKETGPEEPGPKEGDSSATPESYTFYKMLKSKEGDIVPLQDAPQAKKEEEEIKVPAASKEDEKIFRIEKEIEKKIEKSAEKGGVYTVQVAALSGESAANEIMSRLKLKGYAPYLSRGEGQKSLYKIRVGRFPSIVDAQDVSKVLRKDGYDTYVIKTE